MRFLPFLLLIPSCSLTLVLLLLSRRRQIVHERLAAGFLLRRDRVVIQFDEIGQMLDHNLAVVLNLR